MKKFLSTKFTDPNGKHGFTVIEAFVGISILLIGIVGPMTLVNKNFQASRFSRDQITSYYLAQEAIEIIRQVRDDNLLQANTWSNGLTDCRGPNGCIINAFSTSGPRITRCTSAGCRTEKALYINTAGQYGHSSGSGNSNTRFSRYVVMNNSSDEGILTVHVEFDTGRYKQEYKTTIVLANWVQDRTTP